MSYLNDALTYITGFLTTPFLVTPSDEQKPTERGTSYFPNTASRSSRRSSVSSTATTTSTISSDSASAQPPRSVLTRTHTGSNPTTPLDRDFPPPKEDLDFDKLLALEPQKRSLHDSLRRAATTERRPRVEEDAETKAKKLAAAKQQLLALAGRP